MPRCSATRSCSPDGAQSTTGRDSRDRGRRAGTDHDRRRLHRWGSSWSATARTIANRGAGQRTSSSADSFNHAAGPRLPSPRTLPPSSSRATRSERRRRPYLSVSGDDAEIDHNVSATTHSRQHDQHHRRGSQAPAAVDSPQLLSRFANAGGNGAETSVSGWRPQQVHRNVSWSTTSSSAVRREREISNKSSEHLSHNTFLRPRLPAHAAPRHDCHVYGNFSAAPKACGSSRPHRIHATTSKETRLASTRNGGPRSTTARPSPATTDPITVSLIQSLSPTARTTR